MDVVVTIRYSTDNPDVSHSIATMLDHTLPYMVDNVDIDWDVEE